MQNANETSINSSLFIYASYITDHIASTFSLITYKSSKMLSTRDISTHLLALFFMLFVSSFQITVTNAFTYPKTKNHQVGLPSFVSKTQLYEMKRPLLDQIASTLFNLEMNRVESSSTTDSKGRKGEPMEWAESDSLANKFSQIVAGNNIGYAFKQFVADIVAGEYNEQETQDFVQNFVSQSNTKVKMFSFTTCPFCRSAKDYLDQEGIPYESIELDELEGNTGNEIRAVLGKMTKRTSVPSIFINGKAIGGLNDGFPGLMPLATSGELQTMLK